MLTYGLLWSVTRNQMHPARILKCVILILLPLLSTVTVLGQPDSVQIVLAADHADSTKVRMLFGMGRNLWFSRNFSESAYYLKTSVLLAGKSGYLKHQADAYNLLANIALNQEQFDDTFVYLQKAISQQDQKFMPLIQETHSRLYYQLGDYPSALHYALRAAEGYEKDPDTLFNMQAVYAYLIAGDVLSRQKQDDKAFEYYQKAYKKARRSHLNWYIKTPVQKVAHYYYLKDELAKAKHLYDSIIIIDKDSWSHEPTMYSYEGLGRIAMKEKKFKSAIGYYRKAIDHAREKGFTINEENFYTRLGAAFLADGQHDSAMHYLQLAIAQSTES